MNPATISQAPAASELHALRAHLDVEIVLPVDAGWDEARLAWNLAADQHPAAVAFPETADHVVSIVEYAQQHGLRVAPQSTGHNATAIESLAGTLLVKTERMRDVTIDPVNRIARVGAGALWMDVTHPAAEHGLAALAGSSPDVGVLGYTLGGGVSWLARKHGMAANSVTAIELVTADARLIRVDADNEPDLFWALRGGGGSFGVVTAIEFRLLPISHVFAGMVAFPIERAGEVLHAWREWSYSVPDEVTSIGRILRVPPLPDIPEAVRGRELVVVEATVIGDEAYAAELLEPLRALGAEIDTFGVMPVEMLQKLHMDPEDPVPGMSETMLLRELPAAAVDALVDVAGPGRQIPFLSVEIRHVGAAVSRRDPGSGAARIDSPYMMFGVGIAMGPEVIAAIEAYRPVLRAALTPFDSGKGYLNFVEDATDAANLFPDEDVYARLRSVKKQFDPGDLFRSNHPIPPAR